MREGTANLKVISRRLLRAGLPGGFNGAERPWVPGGRTVEEDVLRSALRQQRLDVVLPKGAVDAAAYQPGVKDHRVQAAVALSMGQGRVQYAGGDKKAHSLSQNKALCSGGDNGAARSYDAGLQLRMPVPGDRFPHGIVQVAGGWEEGGAVLNQLPALWVCCGAAG